MADTITIDRQKGAATCPRCQRVIGLRLGRDQMTAATGRGVAAARPRETASIRPHKTKEGKRCGGGGLWVNLRTGELVPQDQRPPAPGERMAAGHREAAAWNEARPIGTEVVVTLDDGSTRNSRTRSVAWVLGDGTPVVKVEGITGGYLLSRVQPRVVRPIGRADGNGNFVGADRVYYIQNVHPGGDLAVFWKPHASGYTCDLDEAGAYLGAELASLNLQEEKDVVWPIDYVHERVGKLVPLAKLRGRR